MSKAGLFAAAVAAALVSSPPAAAQSLFGQPAAPEAAPAPAEAAPRPRARPKPKKPTPTRSITVSNASANTLTSLEISGEGKTARLEKPLGPNQRTTLKLPVFKTCVVAVVAGFEGAGEAEASDYNLCREKSLRFTE